MQKQIHVNCGGNPVVKHNYNSNEELFLRLHGVDGPDKLTLNIEEVQTRMCKEIPDVFIDMAEIATYVYAADQAIKRTYSDDDSFGVRWRRDFHFNIPVRKLDIWNSNEVKECLVETLEYLSDDFYTFSFVQLDRKISFQTYIQLPIEGGLDIPPDIVAMFSGGLDSLAGAVHEILNNRQRVVFVTHNAAFGRNQRL